MYRFIVGDVETTGPTTKDKVVELAWIEIDEHLNVIDRVHSLIDPQHPISSSASGVHGLTNADLQDAPTIEEYFGLVLDRPLDGDLILIAHNSQFDRRYLGPFMPNLVGEMCTLRLARRLWPDAENHKLSTLMYHLGLVRGTSHRADGDVETTLDLVRKIVDKSGQTLLALAVESMEPIIVDVMPFGKHKGTPLKDLPSGYVKWLLDLGDGLDRDMRHSLGLLAKSKG